LTPARASIAEAARHRDRLQRYYRLRDTSFSVLYARDLDDLLHPILGHLELPEPVPNGVSLTIARAGGGWRILRDATTLGGGADLEMLAPLVPGAVSSLTLGRHDYLFALHAGGVSRGEDAMLLVAPSRTGKTVLTGAMLGKGWDYLSDDMILV